MDLDNLSNYEKGKLAWNPSTPLELLVSLAEDKNYSVRHQVAQNPNTPPETLARLAEDEEWLVRVYVAINPNTPQYVKEYLNAMKFVRDYGL
jgi:hypothetical protein